MAAKLPTVSDLRARKGRRQLTMLKVFTLDVWRGPDSDDASNGARWRWDDRRL